MEFLMTYGWAILVVLAAIGALAYFGVLSPDRFLPEKCTLPSGVAKSKTISPLLVGLGLSPRRIGTGPPRFAEPAPIHRRSRAVYPDLSGLETLRTLGTELRGGRQGGAQNFCRLALLGYLRRLTACATRNGNR